MNAFLRKVATVCVAFLLCASMGTIAFANDLPIYSEWAKAEVSAAENEGLLPFEMYDDCRRALHRDWATAFLVKFVEIRLHYRGHQPLSRLVDHQRFNGRRRGNHPD